MSQPEIVIRRAVTLTRIVGHTYNGKYTKRLKKKEKLKLRSLQTNKYVRRQ